MIRCVNCGNSFEEDEIRTRSEYVSEFWGAPAYADVEVCPVCGSEDLEELEDPLDEILSEGESDVE